MSNSSVIPWTIAHQAPVSMGFSEYWSGQPLPSPGDLPDPWLEPMSPELAGGLFSSELSKKPCKSTILQLLNPQKTHTHTNYRFPKNEGINFSLYFNFSSGQSFSCVQLFVTPWIAACQGSLSITNSRSLLKLVSIESVMPSNHLILCHILV